MRTKVRTLRHWKQRFDKNAEFIWRRPIIWQAKLVKAGDPIPEELQKNKTKLRRFWEARVIELAQFEEPDVATGQKPVAVEVFDGSEMLLGSSIQLAETDINDEVISLGEIVGLAFEASGLTVGGWNAQDDKVREDALQMVVGMMTDLGEEDEDETPADEGKDETPDDLVSKETDRKWHVKGIDEVFKSKTLATAKAEAMIAEAKAAESSGDDTWLDGDKSED